VTVAALLASARARLGALPFASGREAHLLLAHVLGASEAWILAHGEDDVGDAACARFAALVEQRAHGRPIAYLTGDKEFFGRTFRVDDRVLVPRPETEHLVEAALRLAPSLPPRPRILGLGTGSGCIAVTLALELAGSRVVAADRSPGALAVARGNARALGANLAALAADWAGALAVERFDLVVSNPPYLDPQDPAVQREVAAHEPPVALFAGRGGLDAYRALLVDLVAARPGTPLLLEIGAGQAAALRALAPARGWQLTAVSEDLAGIERVVELRRR